MRYRIKSIELYVRETPPGRMAFALGKQGGTGDIAKGLLNPLGHVRLVLADAKGRETFGCSGDRLSVRWLDKRPGRSLDLKRRELVKLIHDARAVHLAQPDFDSPFAHWLSCHKQIMKIGKKSDQENLSSAFASALFERAILDAVCRIEQQSIFAMVKRNALGMQADHVHPELKGFAYEKFLPNRPLTEFNIRHTIGLLDPLTVGQIEKGKRVKDGLPQTLDEYIKTDGIRHFKVKISGQVERDIQRLADLWNVVVDAEEPVITLDANEAYTDLAEFKRFIKTLDRDHAGLFQHIEYIEQPLPRALTMDKSTSKTIREISEIKRLLIDEADGTLDSYRTARSIGYEGTSHKNCKGFFKSVMNHAIVIKRSIDGAEGFMSAEDLQNLPVVPLQQDFATLGILGLEHCERNGHHYNFGLQLLSKKDKANALKRHPDLYEKRGQEAFLNIKRGQVSCASLQGPGFGVQDEPDWDSMQPMQKWVQERHAG
jgi:hypothetical protein